MSEPSATTATTVLDQALGRRPLDDARSPARALTWRVRRLGERHAPGRRAQAAGARSTTQRADAPVRAGAATPSPPPAPPGRRR
ncbi:hypothetical protein [Streptomyces beihaiensis]|uniref:hypothetical protein n=1 Tax=Streptomyces beihaiensis TaxID=2984495 RepID=UPI00389B37AF